MNLRPVNFAVPNSTTLKVLFNKILSSSITVENLSVEALSGNSSNLRIISIEIDNKILKINTSPQDNKGFYLLKLNNNNGLFKSKNGYSLINDSNNKTKLLTNIGKNINLIKRNYLLMQLNNVDIPKHIKRKIQGSLHKDIPQLIKYKFQTMFLQDKLQSAIKDFDGWISEFVRLDRFRGING